MWFQGPFLAVGLCYSFRREAFFFFFFGFSTPGKMFQKPADPARDRIIEGPEGPDHRENWNNLQGAGACEPNHGKHSSSQGLDKHSDALLACDSFRRHCAQLSTH